jgi:hypothetical protein
MVQDLPNSMFISPGILIPDSIHHDPAGKIEQPGAIERFFLGRLTARGERDRGGWHQSGLDRAV